MRGPLIVKIEDSLRDSLEECLDRFDRTNKKRLYYLGISMNNYAILLPIRSNCTREFSVALCSDKNRGPKHGIDCAKMIILNRSRAINETTRGFINSITAADIIRKRTQILSMTKKTIKTYQTILDKKRKKIDLNMEEKMLEERSTLKNFIDIIDNLY